MHFLKLGLKQDFLKRGLKTCGGGWGGVCKPGNEFLALGREDEVVKTKNIKCWTSYHQAGGYRFIVNTEH